MVFFHASTILFSSLRSDPPASSIQAFWSALVFSGRETSPLCELGPVKDMYLKALLAGWAVTYSDNLVIKLNHSCKYLSSQGMGRGAFWFCSGPWGTVNN